MTVCAAYLVICDNKLSGEIPSEIGLLTRLGKFIIEKRPTLYSAHVPNCVAIMFHHVIDLMLSCCFVNHFTEYLHIGNNQLGGMIPSVIGQLTKLSEYTRDC